MIEGEIYTIAGKRYCVYNIMEGLNLVGFARVNKNNQMLKLNRPNLMTLSSEQIKTLMKIGTMKGAA